MLRKQKQSDSRQRNKRLLRHYTLPRFENGFTALLARVRTWFSLRIAGRGLLEKGGKVNVAAKAR
jgi:hypothetical protein